MISISLPWPPRELSPNARVHYMAKHRATKRSRVLAAGMTLAAGVRRNDPDIPEKIKATVIFSPPSKRRFDDDNAIASCKAYLDGIADALGIDDSRFQISIRREEVCKGGMVRVELEGGA